uniref:UPAR/Ly6 domain-containing protein n=1 Tax=Cyprinus carpio carpio TaxID=630221 RepID=A0A9J7ZI52_CYPCA
MCLWLDTFFTLGIRLVNQRHNESFCWSVCGVRSGFGGAWYVLSLSLFAPSIRCVFVVFCVIILAKNVSLSLSFKALPLNVTVVRTTWAHALKFETATMMTPVCLSTREVPAHSLFIIVSFCILTNHFHDPLTLHDISLCSPPFLLGGDTHRQCIKYSDCNYNVISEKFPEISSFKFSCCTTDLCNTAPVSVSSRSVVGILLSLALFWWGVL